jgi:creatinine amidohydrolase
MKIKFEELKPQELEQIIQTSGIAYLPLGTLEWHERHLPLGLDAIVSHRLCLEACGRTGGCVIPPLYFGTDREYEVEGKLMHGIDAKVGKEMIGSIYYLHKDLFFEVLKNIASNVSKQGFNKLVVVSAHSGTAQEETLERLKQERMDNLEIIIVPGKKFSGGLDHAGKLETQLALAVSASDVELSALSEPFEGLLGENPLEANLKDGRRQFETIVKQIVELVQA